MIESLLASFSPLDKEHLINYIAPCILWYITFHCMGISHTRPHVPYLGRDEERVKMNQSEERLVIQKLENLPVKLLKDFRKSALLFPDYLMRRFEHA